MWAAARPPTRTPPSSTGAREDLEPKWLRGLMHGFQESKEKFGKFLERRGISPRGRAIVRSVTPGPSQVGSKSQVATTSTALNSEKSESGKKEEVASGSTDPASGDLPAPRAVTPGPTCRLADGAQLPEGSTVKQLIEVFSKGTPITPRGTPDTPDVGDGAGQSRRVDTRVPGSDLTVPGTVTDLNEPPKETVVVGGDDGYVSVSDIPPQTSGFVGTGIPIGSGQFGVDSTDDEQRPAIPFGVGGASRDGRGRGRGRVTVEDIPESSSRTRRRSRGRGRGAGARADSGSARRNTWTPPAAGYQWVQGAWVPPEETHWRWAGGMPYTTSEPPSPGGPPGPCEFLEAAEDDHHAPVFEYLSNHAVGTAELIKKLKSTRWQIGDIISLPYPKEGPSELKKWIGTWFFKGFQKTRTSLTRARFPMDRGMVLRIGRSS